LAAVLFIGATTFAWGNLPAAEPRWWMLVLVGLIGVPLTIVLNGVEYRLSAAVLDHVVPMAEALRISVLSSAANLLPIPGAVLVRTRALNRLGARPGSAFAATGAIAVAWMGTTFGLAGGLLTLRRPLIGSLCLVGGLACLVVAYLLIHRRTDRAIELFFRVVLVEASLVVVGAARLLILLAAIGFEADLIQTVALTISGLVASATGFFPGGLGIRELVIGALSPLVGLPASAGVVAAALDRILALAILGVTAMAFILTERRLNPAVELEEKPD
ncbi:MAG: hypothetical protein PVF87_11555, partial [Acidimicrobiia bacterium]